MAIVSLLIVGCIIFGMESKRHRGVWLNIRAAGVKNAKSTDDKRTSNRNALTMIERTPQPRRATNGENR